MVGVVGLRLYVLPCVGEGVSEVCYCAYSPVNPDKLARKCKSQGKFKLEITLLTPGKPPERTFTEVEERVLGRIYGYFGALEVYRRQVKYLRVVAPVELSLLAALIAREYLAREFIELTLRHVLAAAEFAFFGPFVFFSVVIPGFASFRHLRRIKALERFTRNLKETVVTWEEDNLVKTVDEAFKKAYKVDRPRKEVYEEVRGLCGRIGFKEGEKFYSEALRRIKTQENFATEIIPASWLRKAKNQLKGLTVEPEPFTVFLGPLEWG